VSTMKNTHSHKSVVINKPWGYEYLVYENQHVALWLLHIAHGQQTSMHCHPTKTTGLVLVQGEAELSFLADKKLIKAPEKQMIRRGLFHSTKAVSPNGIFMFEIETPNDKNDLVRLSDKYGRASSGYEGGEHERIKDEDCVWIEEPSDGQQRAYKAHGTAFTVECTSKIDALREKPDDDILIFLRGGLGKHVDGRRHLATIPGDVGRAKIVKQVAHEMEFLEEDTLILTIPQ
jgi:mannose-6-phosphate isomerase-like protein (cupin superfamily)